MWFADDHHFNISTRPTGKQTSNRAELTAVILGLRRAENWPTLYHRITNHTDSMYVVEGVEKWMKRWKADGWTRAGKTLRNGDLWRVLDKVLSEYESKGIEVVITHVPGHVGVHGNERADRLAKAGSQRGHRDAVLTPAERDARRLDGMADAIVAGLLATI